LDKPRRPSIGRLIFADYASLLCFLFPVINWGMFVAAASGYWPDEPGVSISRARFFLWLGVGTTIVCVPILYKRIKGLHSLLREGIPVQARLTSVWFLKDRGRIDYEYTYEGRAYRGGMALTKSKRAGAFREGQEITVLVRPGKPEQSIVPDVFG
jgi:hypothetical protein